MFSYEKQMLNRKANYAFLKQEIMPLSSILSLIINRLLSSKQMIRKLQ